MSCSKCHGDDAETHEDWEHSEDWVNLADARYTGEVIFMPAAIIYDALEALNIPDVIDKRVLAHVDRGVITALVDALYGQYDPEADELGNQLIEQLKSHPLRKLPDEEDEDNS